MMKKLAGLIVVTAIMSCFGEPRASELAYVEVTQIFFEPNEGFHLQPVPYSIYLGSFVPGLELRFMSYENCVREAGYTSGGALGTNRNVLYSLGVRTAVEDKSDFRTWRALGPGGTEGDRVVDTLRVDIEFDSLRVFLSGGRAESEFQTSIAELSRKVVECAVANAARSRPRVLNLRVEFHGPTELKSLNGVYPVPKP